MPACAVLRVRFAVIGTVAAMLPSAAASATAATTTWTLVILALDTRLRLNGCGGDFGFGRGVAACRSFLSRSFLRLPWTGFAAWAAIPAALTVGTAFAGFAPGFRRGCGGGGWVDIGHDFVEIDCGPVRRAGALIAALQAVEMIFRRRQVLVAVEFDPQTVTGLNIG